MNFKKIKELSETDAIILLDNKMEARTLSLIDHLENDNPKMLNLMLINMLPLEKDNDGEIIWDLRKYIDFQGLLPEIKKDAPMEIKEFLNVQLTNEVNRKLKSMIGPVSIDSYDIDRAEIIEAAKEDPRYKKFIELFNENNLDTRITEIEVELIEDLERYKIEGVKSIIYPSAVRFIVLPQELIPKNTELENGKIFRLTSNRKLYKLLNPYMEDGYEILIYTDKDNQYIVTKSVYDYPTIRKLNFDHYWKLSID